MWLGSAGLTFLLRREIVKTRALQMSYQKFRTAFCGAVIKIQLKGNRSSHIRNEADRARSRARNRTPTSPGLYLQAEYNPSPVAKRITSELATSLSFLTLDKRDTLGKQKNKCVSLMEPVYLTRLLRLALHEWVVGSY